MTVQELIDELQKIEDKTQKVFVEHSEEMYECDTVDDYTLRGESGVMIW
jgi:hypothetical protein